MNRATLTYVGPFLAFMVVMALEKLTGLPTVWMYPLRVVVTAAVLWALSRHVLAKRPAMGWWSVALGAAVFALWVGPDVVFGAGYRHFWLFENPVTGKALSSIPAGLRGSFWFLALRTASCALLVPPMEELFWRGWLMRWLVDNDFLKVRLGTYQSLAFWGVALLFASEHGPYWEVGLATGIIYNWWLIRTRNLTDCIIAHAVTNGLLSVYVLATGQFQYWL